MGLIALPQRFTSQPQYAPRLAEAYQDAELLSLFNDGSGQDIARGNHLIPGVAPSPAVRQHGKALSFDGSSQYLLSARTIAPGTQFTVFAWVRPATLNSSYRRIIETAYDTGFYLGSNAGSQYAWIVNNALLEGCIGGQQVVGQRDFLCGVFDGVNRVLYVNGVQVASSTATSPSAAIQVSISRWTSGSGGYYWNGDIDTVGMFNRAFPAPEIWSIYQDPWRLIKAPARRLWVAGGSGINLTGAISIQANAGSTSAIAQVCALTGAVSSQGNTSGSVTVTIDANIHVVGAASTQVNISGAAAINQAYVLLVSISVQVNSSTAIAVAQIHALAEAASTQGNLGGSGAITITGEFVSAPSTQPNFSGTGRIVRTQVLAGANSAQANLSGTGTVSDGIVVESSLTTGATDTIRIKKPGIPAGTPEWLKTMIETLIGRRGNRIEAPKFQTLTFSATPTRTECEALYSYLNTVRDALEQLISRMDG